MTSFRPSTTASLASPPRPLPSHDSKDEMTTRRTKTKVEVPLSSNNHNSPASGTTTANLDSSALSPFLPTPLEAALLAIFPATLILGSLYSTLHSSTRGATYSALTQSYAPTDAPSYFAKKSNILNVYFVKIGWLWITAAFASLLLTHPGLASSTPKRRIQAALRYAAVTGVWVLVTQWCFGAPIIDRSFRWTGGQCEPFTDPAVKYSAEAQAEKAEMNDVREVFTHAACRAIGGQWAGGHDISGHVFLLILGSAMLGLEVFPAVLRMAGLRDTRRVRTEEGLVQSAGSEGSLAASLVDGGVVQKAGLGIGGQFALAVGGVSWWMLLMTAAFFHTWFEKLTGLLVAFTAIYVIYFLPRAVPVLRGVFGMPGV